MTSDDSITHLNMEMPRPMLAALFSLVDEVLRYLTHSLGHDEASPPSWRCLRDAFSSAASASEFLWEVLTTRAGGFGRLNTCADRH